MQNGRDTTVSGERPSLSERIALSREVPKLTDLWPDAVAEDAQSSAPYPVREESSAGQDEPSTGREPERAEPAADRLGPGVPVQPAPGVPDRSPTTGSPDPAAEAELWFGSPARPSQPSPTPSAPTSSAPTPPAPTASPTFAQTEPTPVRPTPGHPVDEPASAASMVDAPRVPPVVRPAPTEPADKRQPVVAKMEPAPVQPVPPVHPQPEASAAPRSGPSVAG
ncbi:hypothetical protein ACFQ0D_35865, partial [Micromonospora zhanjiangensis]